MMINDARSEWNRIEILDSLYLELLKDSDMIFIFLNFIFGLAGRVSSDPWVSGQSELNREFVREP